MYFLFFGSLNQQKTPSAADIKTVSYTHLDVYKRQSVFCSQNLGAGQSDRIKKGLRCGITAVSYTHLDVYKRQEGYIASFEITPASTDDREGLRCV